MGLMRMFLLLMLGVSTTCYAGGNPEDTLSFPDSKSATQPGIDQPAQERILPRNPAPRFTGEADWVYEASDWVLNLYITQKGSRSQGSHGVLLFEGKEVFGKIGEVRALPIGTVRYQGPAESRSHLWDDSGWQMKDPLVKPLVHSRSNVSPRKSPDPEALKKALKATVPE